MECIPASEVATATLNEFLTENKPLNQETLLRDGYVVMADKKIIGCFELGLISSHEYWLKQLFIVQKEALQLPVLLEYILVLVRSKEATMIYAHSEQPVTDLLLESMSFSLQTEQTKLLDQKSYGQWWSYKVS